MSTKIIKGSYNSDFGSNQTPLYFGEEKESQIFGWYHNPVMTTGVRSSPVGVLVCNPFGFEEVAAHRGLREFALECSAQGFPCLRFDYLGCGNSAGDEFTDNLLQQWVNSISTAIHALKQLGNVKQIILVGFRFGFSLAAIASVDRDDILAMVAVCPVIRGRDYLRELRLLTASDQCPTSDSAGIALVPNGFIVSDKTAADIEKIDLSTIKLGTNHVLLLEELQIPARTGLWLQTVQKAGPNIQTSLVDGYLLLASDPQTSKTPRALFAKVLHYMEHWTVGTTEVGDLNMGSSYATPNLTPTHAFLKFSTFLAGPDTAVKESIVSIPTGAQHLFGILHERASGVCESAVIFLNAGAVRNIGPNRMFVPLARDWAEKGFRVLRLDFAGIGDSHPRIVEDGDASYSPKTSEDLAAAVAFLRQLGSSKVILIGLCSGAYHAFRGVVAQVPVDSAILINPLAFDRQDLEDEFDKSFATYEVLDLFANVKRQIRTREFWTKLRRRQLDTATLRKLVIRRFRFSINLAVNGLLRNLNLKHSFDIVQDLRDVLGAGVDLDLLFSESDPGLELLGRRTGRMLPEFQKFKNFHIDVLPNADHTFSNVGARRRLITELNKLLVSGRAVKSLD